MNAATLPAPLRLRAHTTTSITVSDIHTLLSQFLAEEAPLVLTGSGGAAASKAALVRLRDALKDEMKEGSIVKGPGQEKEKKRKNKDQGAPVEGGKRRKV